MTFNVIPRGSSVTPKRIEASDFSLYQEYLPNTYIRGFSWDTGSLSGFTNLRYTIDESFMARIRGIIITADETVTQFVGQISSAEVINGTLGLYLRLNFDANGQPEDAEIVAIGSDDATQNDLLIGTIGFETSHGTIISNSLTYSKLYYSGNNVVGTIEMSALELADIPDNRLYANGQAVSRVTYERLFRAIGTRYGGGDGSTTFNVPNFVTVVPILSSVSGLKRLDDVERNHVDGYTSVTLIPLVVV